MKDLDPMPVRFYRSDSTKMTYRYPSVLFLKLLYERMSCRCVVLGHSLQRDILLLRFILKDMHLGHAFCRKLCHIRLWHKYLLILYINNLPGNICVNISASKMVVLVWLYEVALLPKSFSGSRTIHSFSEFCQVSRRWKYARKAGIWDLQCGN